MAGTRRRTAPPLIRRLLREPHRFEFFQAVRLLEFLQPDREPVGTGMAPGREAVRFRASPGLDFPASDVVGIAPPRGEDDVPEMTISFIGLAGANGPLPRPFTELLLERIARKDTAMRDFLDIFHHRIVSLAYRVRKRARLALHASSPEKADVADRLFALVGLGTLGVRDRMRVQDRALLRYAGLLAQKPRSMHGLERLLSDYFRVPVRGRSLVGEWLPLSEDQQTVIGRRGRNHELGVDAVLGTRVWDQQGRFELVVGPLSLRDFIAFLPLGDRLAKLADLTRYYAGPDFAFDVRLVLRKAEVPAARLGGMPGPIVGWLAWLDGAGAEGDPEIVIRDPERVAAMPEEPTEPRAARATAAAA